MLDQYDAPNTFKIWLYFVYFKNFNLKAQESKLSKNNKMISVSESTFLCSHKFRFLILQLLKKVANVDGKMLNNFLGASFQTVSISLSDTSNLSALFSSS